MSRTTRLNFRLYVPGVRTDRSGNVKKQPLTLCSSSPTKGDETSVPINRRCWRLSVVPGMAVSSLLVTGSQSVQCTTDMLLFIMASNSSLVEPGESTSIWRMGGGSITRRSRSPKPHALAAIGCWRNRMVYVGRDDCMGLLLSVQLFVSTSITYLGSELNKPDIGMADFDSLLDETSEYSEGEF